MRWTKWRGAVAAAVLLAGCSSEVAPSARSAPPPATPSDQERIEIGAVRHGRRRGRDLAMAHGNRNVGRHGGARLGGTHSW